MYEGYPIEVLASGGGVLLGDDVVCDGFHCDRPVRVQTHIHDDHMREFETSKGEQDLYMSEPTLSLLRAQYNADLDHRDNLYPLAMGTTAVLPKSGSRLTLHSSGHMLGSAQVMLETGDGARLGYSGDFHWPLERTIEVDALVLDATYGSPQSVREYGQEEVEARLLELVLARLRHGPVHVKSHRGTIQRALQALASEVEVPILGSDALCKEVRVYQRFGCAVGTMIPSTSAYAKAAIDSRRYIRLYSKGDRVPIEPDGTLIVLSGFMANPRDPVLEYAERSYSVALSNHADFWGTLEFVRATRAKFVLTDNSRMNGVTLAQELCSRLGIRAQPSTSVIKRGWGR